MKHEIHLAAQIVHLLADNIHLIAKSVHLAAKSVHLAAKSVHLAAKVGVHIHQRLIDIDYGNKHFIHDLNALIQPGICLVPSHDLAESGKLPACGSICPFDRGDLNQGVLYLNGSLKPLQLLLVALGYDPDPAVFQVLHNSLYAESNGNIDDPFSIAYLLHLPGDCGGEPFHQKTF